MFEASLVYIQGVQNSQDYTVKLCLERPKKKKNRNKRNMNSCDLSSLGRLVIGKGLFYK